MDSSAINLMWLDYIILAIIMTSTLLSLMRGFVTEGISLSSWVCGAWLALKYSDTVSLWFAPLIHIHQIRWFAAFVSLFAIVIFLGMLLNYIVGQFINKGPLKNIDRFLGMLFGLGRGLLLVTGIIFAIGFTEIPKENEWQKSYFIPKFSNLSDWIKEIVPDSLKKEFGFARILSPMTTETSVHK